MMIGTVMVYVGARGYTRTEAPMGATYKVREASWECCGALVSSNISLATHVQSTCLIMAERSKTVICEIDEISACAANILLSLPCLN